jgi:hypothetical protein
MNQHPVYLSDATYRLLAQRASQESRSLEQIVENLLVQNLALAAESEASTQPNSTLEDTDTALEAVHRLTTLFADVKINWLEQALVDPMLELANADLDVAWL